MKNGRVLLLCDRPGWAFDIAAQALSHELDGRFEFDIRYVTQRPLFDERSYDLIYVYWWGERYHRLMVKDFSKVIKEISSHRWEVEASYGPHTPGEALERYMHDAASLVATSLRLKALFDDKHPYVYHFPNGVDTGLFHPTGGRSGPITIGWAGNINDTTKGVLDILEPACGHEFALLRADGEVDHQEMGEFYNALDVYCVASDAEGTPLPLIEAMACGCFPVCCDVGVVPEVVKHEENGLIVERTPEAFRNAFKWCRENLDLVRKAGKSNAELIAQTRSWPIVAPLFGEILASSIERSHEGKLQLPVTKNRENSLGYSKHLGRMNIGLYSDAGYNGACEYYREELSDVLPESKQANILEIGSGYGHLLRYLLELGYQRVSGIDLSEELLEGVRERLADRLERLEHADAREFLRRFPSRYDCIIMFDVIEHVTQKEAENILQDAYAGLRPGGRIVIRTPNMANILGAYSRFMDITHAHAYTEFSLIQLLERVGFTSVNVKIPTKFSTFRRRLFAQVNRILHRMLIRIMDRTMPKCLDKNVIVWADREAV